MAAHALTPDQLALLTDARALRPPDGAAADAPAIVGQDRAHDAVAFGLAMRHPGHHLYVMGPPGSGKRSLVRGAIAAGLAGPPRPRSDWVYVHNFEQAHQPLALQLPAGQGTRLAQDMRALVDELQATLPAAFESEEYVAALERLNLEFKERTERGLIAVGDEAHGRGLLMLRTPAGFTFVPRRTDLPPGREEVMPEETFAALPVAERERLQQAIAELQDKLLHALRATLRLRKEHADRLRTLNRSTAKLAVDHAVDEVLARHAGLPAVARYLESVRDALIDHADAFRTREDGGAAEGGGAGGKDGGGELARYEVNLLVDAGHDGEPVFEADLPNAQNLLGRVDHVAHFGTLLTDFRYIKPGLLHRANGGFLLVDALKLLQQPLAWPVLKRALLRREVRIESPAELYGLVSTVQLEPQPIPLDVKVVLFGAREIAALLQQHDPEFDELFRVVADLDDDLPRDDDHARALARTLHAQALAAGLLPPDAGALARLLDHAARRSGDARRLSAEVRPLLDLLHEADHHARAAGQAAVDAPALQRAIQARRARRARVDDRLRDAMLRGRLIVDTTGIRVGQVNGLAAYTVGDETFGMPARITATSRLGEGQVIDIQRETRLGGPVHAKGVLILASFVAARFSRHRHHALAASLVFEQTYGLVEGDSASLAELVALLSSIGELPLRQGLAMTGSVDQFGQVQPVGAVNEKLEAFFDLCAARGLDGTQGVLLPARNADQLMLRDDVVDAVRAGRFAVHAVDTVDDALALLGGLPAGDPDRPGDDTANGRIARCLAEFSALRRGEPRRPRRGPPRREPPGRDHEPRR